SHLEPVFSNGIYLCPIYSGHGRVPSDTFSLSNTAHNCPRASGRHLSRLGAHFLWFVKHILTWRLPVLRSGPMNSKRCGPQEAPVSHDTTVSGGEMHHAPE